MIFAQLAAPTPAQPAPDIEIHARVEARRVEVEQRGEARIVLRADPGVAEPVQVQRSNPPGRSSYRNLTIDLKAVARIADPATASASTAASAPAEGEPTGEPE